MSPRQAYHTPSIQHLQQLRRAGLVQTRRDGKRILYRSGGGPLGSLLAALRDYADHQRSEMHGVIHDSLQRRDALQGLTMEQLLEQRSSVVLLDVRPREEFDLGHLPGALNIPVTELRARMDELPRAVHIVAYCRGPYCVLSNDAVAMLREAGLTAQRLAAGYPEWKAAGLQVDLPRH
ncbi:ArsR family transcriptional regulator [Stenotrophomonas sp. C2852]|uniref:ArsR/SmtB family transcription factor n=1 Tax=Stenotrophomonas sp. C2852 TaxID=3077845 RepID=UPI00293C171F|nr:ArsR family transcriptional regulator [Stenotrophomonas sp. C2852]MDV3435701.1 ArsR family transcriptional regulator [Stenotrophomonas sp. C2852]